MYPSDHTHTKALVSEPLLAYIRVYQANPTGIRYSLSGTIANQRQPSMAAISPLRQGTRYCSYSFHLVSSLELSHRRLWFRESYQPYPLVILCSLNHIPNWWRALYRDLAVGNSKPCIWCQAYHWIGHHHFHCRFNILCTYVCSSDIALLCVDTNLTPASLRIVSTSVSKSIRTLSFNCSFERHRPYSAYSLPDLLLKSANVTIGSLHPL